MTVTTNTLGTNSAEIVVFNHARYYDALTAVGSFLTSHGWTEKAGVGNALEKVYTSNNTLGSGVKEIKINAIDLHIQHADSFTGTTTVVATNDCEKVVHNEYLKYPENLFTSTTGSNTFNGSVSQSISPHSSITDDKDSSNYLTGTIFNSNYNITITAGLAVTLYKGQFIRLVSQNDPKNVYLDAVVDSHDNVTGVVTLKPFHKGPTSTTETSWYLLTHSMNYDTAINPGYIYISASSKHCVIQCRNTGGYWHDFTAVCETENPLAVDDASILTTGYMLGNSGNTNHDTTYLDTEALSQLSASYTAPPPATRNNHYNRLRIWTGPFSQPSTRKGRTGWTGRLSKITTPLGEVNGCLGISVTTRHTDFVQEYDQPADIDNRFRYNISTNVHWNSVGDIIPSTYEPVLGNYWALSGTVVTDLSDETSFSQHSINNVMLDTWAGTSTVLGPIQSTHGHPYLFVNNTYAYSTQRNAEVGQYNTPTQKMQWRTSEPTLLGRIYNMKFVTSTLTPTNVLSIAIDANGFVDSSGVASDHIVFSYPSDYKYDSTTPYATENYSDETSEKSERIKDTMSVAVAFPK
jgi:hypothetical protein